MCGITGFVSHHQASSAEQLELKIKKMADRLHHRGPDDSGTWLDANLGVALGHRRLAIIDLSPAGHQPMVSASGRFVIAYNGEVYNFAELRTRLESRGSTFRGSSDTEVILEGISSWGIESTVENLIGMFAIAVWDRLKNELTLIRDRLGIKPVYWSLQSGNFCFGSELKALLAFPDWQPELNRDAIASFLRHNYIPAPHSIYRDVFKLEPGTLLRYQPGDKPELRKYWDFRQIAAKAVAERKDCSHKDSLDSLDLLLRDAVGRRMVADVPLGSLLSGGVDSSLVTALMQVQSDRPIKSFTIGFSESEFNEAPHAAKIAAHLGTDHTELYVSPHHAVDLIPEIPKWFDEPFSDSSQIPTYLVSQLTRQHVTVVLSGDGGDELFAGYNRYAIGADIWKRMQRFPHPVRHAGGSILRSIPESLLDRLAMLIPPGKRPGQFGHKVHKLADGLLHHDPDAMYLQLVSHWSHPDDIVIGGQEPKGHLWNESYRQSIPDFRERMQFLDTLTYLPDDILTKVDRTSMAVGLEARVPLLDHRVVEFAWSLPLEFKTQHGQSKILLRELLDRYVPRSLIERPKMGFGVPIDRWLRDSLRDWAESLLDVDRLREQGLLNPAPIRAKWDAHLKGENWAYPLWDVLMLQSWLDHYEW